MTVVIKKSRENLNNAMECNKKGVHGSDIAEDTYERNNTFRQLLTGLGVDEKTAASDACEMEHAVSRESYEALKMLLMQMEAFYT